MRAWKEGRKFKTDIILDELITGPGKQCATLLDELSLLDLFNVAWT